MEFFDTRKPHSEVLRKYIPYYYFHTSGESRKIIFYPNTVNAITFYKSSELVFDGRYSKAFHRPNHAPRFIYAGLQTQYRVSEMEAPFDKIAVAFSPLGINAFLKVPLSEAIESGFFIKPDQFENEAALFGSVFSADGIEERIRILDAFFLKHLVGFEDVLLEKTIKSIESSDGKTSVSNLADAFGTTTKTLNRRFRKHLNCSVKEYLEVAQFRKSFNHFLESEKAGSLTELAYSFDYYDQAEFTKRFRKITGINPKKLFKDVEKFGTESLFWSVTE
ncbi:helix-turn-helix domain-containing protein [Flavobacterium silvaticum]|uniref:AraC family transcriptional regulator n=1 Tax=Flavobacterium silvaticum TaxID=1852020 RepID=A0A972FT01_9FLAO|nr:helix-turn-helix domain-containing protein [Flavobacterium silvaticum]NMH27923.1 AraC family transcriptional regulator [Flavobacterium silvaticum]